MRFEEQVGIKLRDTFPFAVLSNIPLYRPDVHEERLAGYEIDHLLHASSPLVDRVFIIECKEPPIFGSARDEQPRPGGPWNIERPEGWRNTKRQVENHARALMSYLRGISRDLRIEAWVVSRDYIGPNLEYQKGRIRFRLISGLRLNEELRALTQAERIVRAGQSALLGALRRGLPLSEVGHPELGNALGYVARCRNAIDVELFRSFEPTTGWWAINGSAGMGKSVLLAYSLFVFASDKRVEPNPDGAESSWSLTPFEARAVELGLPTLANRSIFAMARKEKQVRGLEELWSRFVAEYSKLESSLNVRFNRPVFRRWTGEIPPECNVLVIDEAHDIPPEHHAKIVQWLRAGEQQTDELRRYLAIACDRHQLLRLVGTDAHLIRGISFSGHTRKLRRNYRNPFPVYAGSLALMFRWFARSGPKIIPTLEQLRDEFGFEVGERGARRDERTSLGIWNDSHPGNYWSFTVSKASSCDEIFSQLANEGFGKNDVLWVRFSAEDDAFDYEKLGRFTYHNCFSNESAELVDKYIKGQEFPVVIIEGFPRDVETEDWNPAEENEAERQMWKARRELYLCCSRSTCFLYFIEARTDDARSQGPAEEVAELVRQLSHPQNHDAVTRRVWTLSFQSTGVVRAVPTFSDEVEPQAELPPNLNSVSMCRPVTAKALATTLGLQPSVLIEPLSNLGFTLRTVRDVVPDSTAKELALKFGAILEITDGESGPGDGIPPKPAGGVPTSHQPDSPASGGIARQPESPTPPTQPREGANEFETALIQFVKSREFKRHNAKVDRYRALLAWLLARKSELREGLLRYDRGRNRKYFATSKEEIDRHANSANAQPIATTGLWALTTTSTDLKLSVLNDVMHGIGISLPARQEVLRQF